MATGLFFAGVVHPDGQRSSLAWRQAALAGVAEVWQTVRNLHHYQNVARYLLARMFFNDGMVGVLILAAFTLPAFWLGLLGITYLRSVYQHLCHGGGLCWWQVG